MNDPIQNYNNEAQYISDTSDEYTSDKAESSTINQKKRKYTRDKKDDEDIKIKWQENLADNVSKPIIRSKNIIQSNITTHYQHITPISDAKAKELDQAILKAWVCCGFSFQTIENPFIIDLFKLAISGYTLLSRTILSVRLLEQETARIDRKIEHELLNEHNLTL
ncbi:23608_t:CDS:2, partial [Cetraspora pellucida]